MSSQLPSSDSQHSAGKKSMSDNKQAFGENFSADDMMSFIKGNKLDTLAYLVLFCGLLMSIFDRFVGGFVVGTILGLYFSKVLKNRVESIKEIIEQEGIFRSFVLIAAALALFIASPGLCIGAVVGTFLKPAFGNLISESKWHVKNDTEHSEK